MTPKQKRRNKMRERKLFKILSSIAFIVCISMILVGCAGHQKGDTYKIMLGTKCADNGTIQSPIWFHTTIGPDQVSKERCNGRSK